MTRIVVLVACAGAASAALGQNFGGSMTDGNATYNLGPSPTFAFPTSPTALNGPLSDLLLGAQDQLFEDWWWYRVAGSNREFNLANARTRVFNPSGPANATYTYDLQGVPGAAPLQATLRYDFSQPAGNNTALVVQRMRITNTNPAAVSMSLFHYLDLDLNGTAGTDTATLTTPNERMRVQDAGVFADYWGIGASAYRADVFANVRNSLTNGTVDNWSNTGLPFASGDWTGSYQWNLTIAPGGSVDVIMSYGINTPAVPAPGAIALLGLGGLLGVRRRR